MFIAETLNFGTCKELFSEHVRNFLHKKLFKKMHVPEDGEHAIIGIPHDL